VVINLILIEVAILSTFKANADQCTPLIEVFWTILADAYDLASVPVSITGNPFHTVTDLIAVGCVDVDEVFHFSLSFGFFLLLLFYTIGFVASSPLNLKLFCDPRVVFQFAFLNIEATSFHGFFPCGEHTNSLRVFPTLNASNIDGHDFLPFRFPFFLMPLF